jgi:ribosomal protein S18 acetylase RimI-like enzyme
MDYFYIFAKKPDGELIGQACIEKDSNYIFSVSVNPDYQGIGLGKILMKKAEQFATGDIFLSVSKDNLKVLDFYKKLDYELDSKDEDGDLILRKDKRLLIFESVLKSCRD